MLRPRLRLHGGLLPWPLPLRHSSKLERISQNCWKRINDNNRPRWRTRRLKAPECRHTERASNTRTAGRGSPDAGYAYTAGGYRRRGSGRAVDLRRRQFALGFRFLRSVFDSGRVIFPVGTKGKGRRKGAEKKNTFILITLRIKCHEKNSSFCHLFQP